MAKRIKDCQDRGTLVAEVLSIGVVSPLFDHRLVGADLRTRDAGGEFAGEGAGAIGEEDEREEADKGHGTRYATDLAGSTSYHHRQSITNVPTQGEAGDIGTKRWGKQDDRHIPTRCLQEAGNQVLIFNHHIIPPCVLTGAVDDLYSSLGPVHLIEGGTEIEVDAARDE